MPVEPLPGPLTYRDGDLWAPDDTFVCRLRAFGTDHPVRDATGRRLALAYTVHDKMVGELRYVIDQMNDEFPTEWKRRKAIIERLSLVLAEVARLSGEAGHAG